MNYFYTAKAIFDWLTQYQIQQKKITAQRINEEIRYVLHHPVNGEMTVTQQLPEKQYFRSHGIGLKIEKREADKVELMVYDSGGIYDPVDQFVPGDHYATTHFALIGALLYRETPHHHLLDKIKHAIDFHIRTSREEYFFSEGGYHWDFKNYSFLESFRLIENDLPENDRKRWIKALKSYKENPMRFPTNWYTMRAYSATIRKKLLGVLFDNIKQWRWLNKVKAAYLDDGCFDDSYQLSRPIQYHVYILALLHRIILIQPDLKLKEYFIRGIRFFIRFIDPDGCFNYLGRGQEQIFGYGAALYALEAAKLLDKSNSNEYQSCISKVWDHLYQFRNKDGHFPLVLNHQPDKDRCGYYDYHHLTVYNAFLGVWLAMAHTLYSGDIPSPGEKTLPEKVIIDYSPPSGTLKVVSPRYFIFLNKGTIRYLSESSITPYHIWFKKVGWFFSCPGGPSLHRYGKIKRIQNIEKNMCAPLIMIHGNDWILPAYKECQEFSIGSNSVLMIFDYNYCILKRKVSFFTDKIIINDTFRFNNDDRILEFRIFNIPIVIDKFEIEIIEKRLLLKTEKGIIQVKIEELYTDDLKFEKLETIQTAKGTAVIIAMREISFLPVKDQEKSICFSISEL